MLEQYKLHGRCFTENRSRPASISLDIQVRESRLYDHNYKYSLAPPFDNFC